MVEKVTLFIVLEFKSLVNLCHSETQQSDSLVKMPTTSFLEMVIPVTIYRHELEMQRKTPIVWI